MTIIRAAGWLGSFASIRGSAHEGLNVPNEDAVGIDVIGDGRGPRGLFVAIADGHGGERYTRSGTGAALAVKVATSSVISSTEMLDLPRGEVDHYLRRKLIPQVVQSWVEEIGRDYENDPPHSWHLEEPINLSDIRLLYGTTLTFAVANDEWITLAQLGDGDVITLGLDGVGAPVPSDPRSVAGATRSLADQEAVTGFRTTTLIANSVTLVLIATDGYGNSFESQDWRDPLANDYSRLIDRRGFQVVANSLGGWLEESARVGGDDVSVALLWRGGDLV